MHQRLSPWSRHSAMTNPGFMVGLIRDLPPDAASLVRVVQGLLVHGDWLGLYGDLGAFGEASRATLPVAERLSRLAREDILDLTARPPTKREIGTCRDYALLLCALLRTTGTPARVRCGFAGYFRPGWEDHWLCEHWDAGRGRWLLADAQLDTVIGPALGIAFDPADVPLEGFLTAGEAWRRVRVGFADPDSFGHGDDGRGRWFLAVNVVRDSLALGDRITSAWDRWREAPTAKRFVTEAETAWLDGLARSPQELIDEPAPSWLGRSLR